MRPSSRHGLAFFGSLAVHAAVVAWGSFSLIPRLSLPEIELELAEVELIDPDQLQGQEPPAEPEPIAEVPPSPAAPPAPEGEGPEAKKDEPEKKKPKPFAARRSQVADLGPTASTFYLLLSNKKVDPLPFSGEAVEIMAPLPDFQFIVQGGGFHPLRDFDYIVIASTNILDLTQTFLAVEYDVPREELISGIERAAAAQGHEMKWEQRGGVQLANPRPVDPERPDHDPRYFVVLDDKIAMYLREEFLEHVLAGEASDAKTSGNFVANLSRLRRFAERQPGAGMQLVMKDLHSAVRRAKNLPFPLPQSLEISAEAAVEPELVLRMAFATPEDAAAAERFWKEDLRRLVEDNLTVRLTAKWLYDLLELELEDATLTLRGRLAEAQAKQVLGLVAGQSRRFLRRSEEDMAARRAEREAAWARRGNGRLPPSAGVTATKGAEPAPAPPAGAPPAEKAAPPGTQDPLPSLASEPAKAVEDERTSKDL